MSYLNLIIGRYWVINMKIRELQGLLYAALNQNNKHNPKLVKLVDEARETIVDILMEGATKQDILEAIVELLIVATMLKIDVEKELNKFIGEEASVIIS